MRGSGSPRSSVAAGEARAEAARQGRRRPRAADLGGQADRGGGAVRRVARRLALGVDEAGVAVREHPLGAVAVVGGRGRHSIATSVPWPSAGRNAPVWKSNAPDPEVVAAVGEDEAGIAVAAVAGRAVGSVAGGVELEVGDRGGGDLGFRQHAGLADCQADEQRSSREDQAERQQAGVVPAASGLGSLASIVISARLRRISRDASDFRAGPASAPPPEAGGRNVSRGVAPWHVCC